MKSSILVIFIAALFATGCGSAIDPFDDGTSARVPGIAIISPSSAGQAADTTFTIQASFASVILGDTWSLYYVSAATPNRGYAIFTGFSVTNRNINWDTTEMPSGDYYVYGELVSNDSLLTSIAPGYISVDHASEGNISPSVSLSSPNGNASYAVGSDVSIAFNATDPNADTLTTTIEYSSNDGQTWEEITSDAGASPYTWTIGSSVTPGPYYRIRVSTDDGSKGTASDVSAANFAITAAE